MGRYRILEHTADKGIEASAGDLPALFETAARGLFALMIDPDTCTPSEEMSIELRAIDREMLLVRWLNELLYYFEVHKRLFCEFQVAITESDGTQQLHANALYRPVDPQEIEWTGAPVKSATYHGLILEQREEGWFLRFYVDV